MEDPCEVCREYLVEPVLVLHPYTVVKCLRCGFIYVIPRPGLPDLESIYEESYFTGQGPYGYKPGENYLYDDTRLGIFVERIATIERYRKPPGFMVDVGCANGFSLRAARDRGWECIGIDISEFAVNFARERYGLNVIRGTLRQVALGDASVDVLTMWDFIEHVPSPREECMEANRIVKPGGILALSTPDADAPNPSPESCDPAKAAFWQADPPEHLQYFNASTISRLLADTGFHVVNLIFFGKGDRREGAMEVYAVKGG
ncbi:MAG TPA: class I SAM-dependent methyltransferase [Firmicutes bacterium]|nr:class I SAM-dependent methyltransferase [Bacillota bacterium]